MITPNCRLDEDYNEDFLNKEDEKELIGFDEATRAVRAFFGNVDVYETEFARLFEALGIPANTTKYIFNADEDVLFSEKDISEYTEEEYIRMNAVTKLFKTFESCIRDNLEKIRNEVIVSLIDDYDEDEKESLKKEGMIKNGLKPHPKAYHDTCSFKYLSNKPSN